MVTPADPGSVAFEGDGHEASPASPTISSRTTIWFHRCASGSTANRARRAAAAPSFN